MFLLSNHCHVLVLLDENPRASLDDLADLVGITPRAIHSLINDLVDTGLVERKRAGKGNEYAISYTARLIHPLHRHVSVGELLAVLRRPRGSGARGQ